MENLRIYKIKDHYIRFIHSVDSKVQFNKDAKRPYVGVVFQFGGYQYFVPMESPKPNHATIKSGKHILKLDGGKYEITIYTSCCNADKGIYYYTTYNVYSSSLNARGFINISYIEPIV